MPKGSSEPVYDISSRMKGAKDGEALRFGTIIYNLSPQDYEGEMAKNIAFGEYLKKLKRKRSKLVRGSGIFDLKYEPVKISSLPNAELLKLHELYASRLGTYEGVRDIELSEDEEGYRIIYATSTKAIRKELGKRNLIDTSREILMNLIGIAATIAAAAI